MNRRTKMKSFTNPKIATAFLLFGVSLLFHGCAAQEKEPEVVAEVQTTPAESGPISETVSAEAVVFPLEQSIITPKITSTISKFYVQRGSRVKKGQLLAEVESADLAGAAEQSKGEFEQAEAGYATTTGASLPQQIQKAELDATTAKGAYEAQLKVYEARKDLFNQGALPRRDLDSAEVAMAQARSANQQAQKQLADLQRIGKEQALKSAGGQLSAAKGKYLNAKAMLGYSKIYSPIDGVVTERPLFQGELATANQPIMTVMNTSKLVAKAHMAQNEAVLLRAGNPAELQLAGLDEPIKGRVMLVSPALDSGGTTIEVWVEAIKPPAALKPGMNVGVTATAKTVKEAIFVPASAVFKTAEGQDYVLIAGSDDKAHQAKVKVGIKNKELAQIESGVKEKDPIITVGGYALPDGTKIKVEAAPAPEAADEKEGAGKDDKGGKDDKADPADKADAADGKKSVTTAADKKPAKNAPPAKSPAKGKE
jgi:HlyD family secretion protein